MSFEKIFILFEDISLSPYKYGKVGRTFFAFHGLGETFVYIIALIVVKTVVVNYCLLWITIFIFHINDTFLDLPVWVKCFAIFPSSLKKLTQSKGG